MRLSRIRLGMYLALLLPFVVPAVFAQEPISLTVDATQTSRKLLHAKLVLPVKPGPLTLYYPKWIPGEHGPDGPVANLTGLKFVVGGKTIPWRRDTLDVFTFHVDVPAGADRL